jgi:hypothetical protein
MNDIQKRFLLFIFGCISTRLYLTYRIKNADIENLEYYSYLALIPMLGWFYLIFIGNRDTGGEVFGDVIWWKNLRIIHLILWTTFFYMAYNKNKNAWIILLIDTIFGLIMFLNYHKNQNNFQYLSIF